MIVTDQTLERRHIMLSKNFTENGLGSRVNIPDRIGKTVEKIFNNFLDLFKSSDVSSIKIIKLFLEIGRLSFHLSITEEIKPKTKPRQSGDDNNKSRK
jgi:hypothetical protein